MSVAYEITVKRISTEVKETSEFQNLHKKASDGTDEYGYVKITKPVTDTTEIYKQRTEKDIEVKPLIDAFNACIKAY